MPNPQPPEEAVDILVDRHFARLPAHLATPGQRWEWRGKLRDDLAQALLVIYADLRERALGDEALAAGAEALENEVGLPDGFEWPCGSTDEALRPAVAAAFDAAMKGGEG